MSIISRIITLLLMSVGCLQTIFFYRLVSCFAKPRENKLLKLFAFFILFCICNVVIFIEDVVNISFAFAGFIFVMLIGYRGKTMNKLSAVFVLYPLVVTLNFFIGFWERPLHVFGLNAYSAYRFFLSMVSIGFWYLMERLFYDKIRRASRYLNDWMWALLDIICLAPISTLFVNVIHTQSGEIAYLFPIVTSVLISNIGIIFLIGYMAKTVGIRLENQNYRLQQNYYKELENNQMEIRKLRHDMKHHLLTIQEFLEREDMEGAKGYFQSLSLQISGSSRIFCKNSLVNAVVNAKYNQAVEQKIECFFHISIDKIEKVDDLDLCSLFANLLDNAIEAASLLAEKKRKLEAKARYDKGFLSIQVKNTHQNTIIKRNGVMISSKLNKKMHGFGLRNVQEIVDKYNGNLEITYTDEEFCVLLLL